jgi:hypothetical protein
MRVTAELKYSHRPLSVSEHQRVTYNSFAHGLLLEQGSSVILENRTVTGLPLVMETDDPFKIKFNIILPSTTK